MTRGELADQLRATGLRVTAPRLAVLEALAELGGHRTAEEIHDVASEVARMSVYNALADLTRVGLVLAADTGKGAARYELGGDWHHHFVCRVCGRVEDVQCVRGRKPCLTPDLPGAVVDEAAVVFRGVCARCATTRSKRRRRSSRV